MNIPGYRIEKELGHGGMATVYLAVQESLNRKVALKVMAPALAADRSFSERFLREARTIAGLNHPNIIAVYDVGIHDHAHFIAMEYVEAGDLKERIRQNPVPPAEALRVIAQVAAALDYAHNRGYVHRDIKPENILFRADGSAVLTDFGIAKSMDANTRMTGTGMSIGTPHYMSPEQARGRTVSGQSDLYSLGVVLYEILTGHVPFDASDTLAIAFAHVNDPVPNLPTRLQHYQPLIDHLLDKEPDQRLASGPVLIAAIDRFTATGHFGLAAKPSAKADPAPTASASPGLKWGIGGAAMASALFMGYLVFEEQSVSAIPAVTAPVELQAELSEVRPRESGQQMVAELEQALTGQSSPASKPAALSAEEIRQQTINQLLVNAQKDIGALRLQKPAGNNAVGKYREVLRLVPGHSGAVAGLKAVGNRYYGLAQSAFNKHEYTKAQTYLDSAVELDAELKGNSGLTALRKQIKEAQDVLPDWVPEMVSIPAGTFRMGDIQGGGWSSEKPVHRVRVPAFKMGKYPVTFAQYDHFARATGRSLPDDRGWGRGNRPVINVSWEDATAYTQWLSQQTGKTFRLPSEAQWEYAARAGTTTKYSWGNEIGKNNTVCDGCGSRWDDKQTAQVGSFSPNPWGLYDMLGNVWEWTEDCWHKNYEEAPEDGSSWTTGGECARRVVRGGSWDFTPRWVRAAYRYWFGATYRVDDLGFRVSQVL